MEGVDFDVEGVREVVWVYGWGVDGVGGGYVDVSA